MERYSRIPLLFFLLATTLGLVLRWQLIAPSPYIQYAHWLHAHSHIMFLGWVFNALYFAFVYSYWKEKWNNRYRSLFILLQILTVGMLISFPIQGYGIFTIVLSTLHTLLAVWFIILFLRDARSIPDTNLVSLTSIKISLFFFLLSTLGPFSLGYIMSSGQGQSNWYYFSVYYYLHFQYNGFFFFGILGLFFKLLEERKISYAHNLATKAIRWMAVACIPAYFLSTLWANPEMIFNWIGLMGATFQIIALVLLFRSCRNSYQTLKVNVKPISLFALNVVFISLVVKAVLQIVSSLPIVAQLAYEFRNYVIAYLHLVLLGIVSLFIFIWFIEQGLLRLKRIKFSLIFFIIGLTGMEMLLISAPSLSSRGVSTSFVQEGILLFSIILWISAGDFFVASFIKKR